MDRIAGVNITQNKILRELGQDSNMDIVVKDGRYGIYITNGKVNVTTIYFT